MIRAFGVSLGIATTRPIGGLFFAARRLSPLEFFGTAFRLGFTLTLLAAEAWISLLGPAVPTESAIDPWCADPRPIRRLRHQPI